MRGRFDGQLPTTPTAPQAPQAPTVDAQTVASVSGSETLQSGVQVSGQAQSTAAEAKTVAADPSGAAKGAATAKVSGEVVSRAPIDPTVARGQVDGAVGAYQDPKGAAKAEADSRVQTLEEAEKLKAEDKVGISGSVTVGTKPETK